MPGMWTMGGLPLPALLKRTWSESWRDAVFGQAGRMAFYHFLAIFPVLLIFLALAGQLPSAGPELKETVAALIAGFLPQQTATLIQQMLGELTRHVPAGVHLLLSCAGALWATLNGTWALVHGLNTAYEVEECRAWWKIGITILGLTLSLAFEGTIGLVLAFSAAWIKLQASHQPTSFYSAVASLHGLQWLIALALLMLSFAIIYRFAPNLRDPDWKWSTPGAVCALLLWATATLGLRFYFQHIDDYSRTYGHLNGVAMLLLWLYLTNGAILIGGEMNSEIEKAAAAGKNANRSGS